MARKSKKSHRKSKQPAGANRRRREADHLLAQVEARRQRGDFDGMLAACEAAVAEDPRHAGAHHLLARLCFAAGDQDRARAHSARAVELAPDAVDLLVTRAEILAEAHEVMAALASLERAQALAPRSTRVLNVTANLYRRCNRPVEAFKLLKRSREIDPEKAETLALVGDAFLELGKVKQAVASFRLALRQAPHDATIHDKLGRALQSTRDREGAAACFQRAIACQPGLVEPHVHLAAVKTGERGAPEIAALEALERKRPLTVRDEVQIHAALGKLHDDCGDHQRAFANVRQANEIRRRAAGPFDIDQTIAHVNALQRCFTADLFAGRECASTSQLPVFVVGMPRSGTTLVETIVACHPDAHGAGELVHVGDMARALLTSRSPDGWREHLEALPSRSLAELAGSYLAHLQAMAPEALRIVDKMPHNFQHLWLVALLFPGARVVHCRRDPRDVCLSCYFADFELTHGYRHDLRTLGRYYRQYVRLMEHWREVLPLSILDVWYEDLVTDQEAESRRLLAHVGLDWNAACLDFHRSRRSVRTASNVQVGQRMYTSSIGRWRNYEPWLEPLLAELGELPAAASAGALSRRSPASGADAVPAR